MFNKNGLKTSATAAMICVGATMASATENVDPTDEVTLANSQVIEDVGGAERINVSGKLRMLSQRIPAAACNLHADVNPKQSAKILAAASAEFNKIINGLEYGDPSLGINGKETRRKSIAAIKDVKAQWEPFGAATNLILQEGTSASLNKQLAEQNGALLDAAKILVSQLVGQYSDPAAMVQADALRIDIAGRQRMLSQKISKDLCLTLSDVNAEKAVESLAQAISTFDVSLTALRDGMPAAGIAASEDPDIVTGLNVVASQWAALQPHFGTVLETRKLDQQTRADVFDQLNTLLVDMNKVVGLYAQVSKQNI